MSRAARSGWHGFLAAAALVIACLSPAIAAVPTLHGVDLSDPRVPGVIKVLTDLGTTSQEIADLLANATSVDGLADWIDPTSLNPSKVHAAGADITTSTVFEVHTTPEQAARWFGAGGPLNPGSPGVVSPVMPRGGPVEHDFYAYATTVSVPPSSTAGFRAEVGLAAFSATPPGGAPGIPWQASASFPGDFFNGMNLAWSTRSEDRGPFKLHALWYLKQGGGFAESKTDAVSVMNGNAVVTLIPESEASGFTIQRAFGFLGSLDFNPATFAADTYPDITKPPVPIAGLPELHIGTTGTQETTSPITGPFDPANCTGAPFMVDKFGVDLALNGGLPTTFNTGGKAICLNHVATYHWNDGVGAPQGGTISVTGPGGASVGSWPARATPGTNDLLVNWETVPFTPILINGTYTVLDSDPATWSQSKASGGLGFIRVWGVEYVQPARPAASATSAPASPSPTGTTTTADTGSGVPWIVVLAGGLIIVMLGAWLYFFGRKVRPGGGGPAMGGDVVSIGGTGQAVDPCPPLLAALAAAKAACEDATKAAAAADATARAAAAAADAAKKSADRATVAREAAEKELANRQKPPEATTLGSTDYGGRHVEVSDYDLYLQAQARAEANAAHDAAVAAATSEAGRVQAGNDWADALRKVDGPDGLDEVRKRDSEFRQKWIREAEDALKAAKDAEDSAKAEADRAAAAAKSAADAAGAARKAADDACAAAAAAEKAAMDAGCIGPAKPATPPAPQPHAGPGPQPGPDPSPPKPGGTTDGLGGDDGPMPGGGSKPQPPTPSKPHGRDCPDGTQEWRRGGPTATFLVPIPGAKIQASCEPGIEAFQEWLDGWTAFDADGKQSGGSSPGIPSIAFAHEDLSAWTRMFGKIEKKAKHYDISFTLPLQEVTVHCERLYTCVNGSWVRQAATRAVESDPEPKPKSFTISAEAVTTNEVAKMAMQAVAAWKAAQQAALDLAAFYLRCR